MVLIVPLAGFDFHWRLIVYLFLPMVLAGVERIFCGGHWFLLDSAQLRISGFDFRWECDFWRECHWILPHNIRLF